LALEGRGVWLETPNGAWTTFGVESNEDSEVAVTDNSVVSAI